MIIDTSVIVQVIRREPGWEQSLGVLEQQKSRRTSVASVIEVQAVLSRDQTVAPEEAIERLDRFFTEANIEVVPLSLKQSRLAREAYLACGKRQGHPASLNYGDVMSYALAKALSETLAFVGDDFQHTDLKTLRLPLGSEA